jgi:hypothetical protein
LKKRNQNKFFNKIAYNVMNQKARYLHSLVVPVHAFHIPLMRNRARARQSCALLVFPSYLSFSRLY